MWICRATYKASSLLLLLVLVTTFGTSAVHGAERIYKIGFLGQTEAPSMKRQIAALKDGLQAAGYAEGRNLVIEYRWAERKLAQLPTLARELVESGVDVIVTHGSAGSRAAKNATESIPVVIAVIGYPVESGVVASLSRPGGNVTGLVLHEFETAAKWFQILREAVPSASRIGWLDVPGIEQPERAEAQAKEEDAAASSTGFEVQRVVVRGANDLRAAFERFGRGGVHAVVVPNTSLLNPLSSQIANLAIEYRLPTIGSLLFARAGGLIGYGPDGAEMYRRAAGYVHKVLQGARAGELPMEEPPKFELVVNLKASKTIGMTIPAGLLSKANEKIE